MRTLGTIRIVFPLKGYGFLDSREGRNVFFHVDDLQTPLEWGEQLTERRVEFDVVDMPRGPRAQNITLAAE